MKMYKMKEVNGKRSIEEINVSKLAEIGKISKDAFIETIKELDGKAEFHPDAMEDIFRATDALGWSEEEIFDKLGWR
jgi:hypothetical protein